MTDLFDIEKFNVISDDENYYFFRNLGSGDIEDIEKGIITAESGYARIRTDRERWEESHENTKWSKESKVSLEEVYDHIKYNHSYQTNCISLTSNPYIAKMYGESFSKKYVMITVPKKEMGDRVFHVGKYMLDEIQKRIEEYLANNEVDSSVLEDLENVEHATNSSEIKELIKTRYVAPKPIDTRKSSMRKDITYSAQHSRISSWQALDEEQNLAKNKIIGKLTILEQKGRMPRILKKSKDNRKLLVNIGGSFSSAEQIYYGEIVGERVQDISKEMLDMFGLLQQAESQDRELVKELESELIRAVKKGRQIEILNESPLNSTYEVKSDISIEEMYELTEGKVDYTKANDVVQKMFYLSRSRLYAVELAKLLNQLTGNNPKYKEIIDYIEKNGFNIEPQIFNRKTDSGVEVVGTVNLSLNENEKVLAEKIKELAPEEYIQVLENGGLYDVQNIISSTFSSLKLNEQMSKEGYYAQAIIDSYNWNEMSEKGLNDEARKELIEKLQEFDVIEIYENLKKAGVQEKDISKYVLNIVSRESLLKAEDFSKMLLENEEVLKHKLSVEQVDRFLGYYDVKDSNFELRDYQQDAFDKSKELLSRKRFAAVVMPTGGGKSFVTMQHLLEHKDEKMLYLAPDDEILNQMMDYIIEYIPGLSKTSENTSKKEIVKQVFPNMDFETYPGLMATRSKELLKEQFDFIVLDELHRTGAEKWEKKLDELLENQEEKNRVLGITATPTRDVDGRDMSVETAVKLGYTREEAEKGEHIAYYLDLVEAIQLGLVVNPKIVSCEYTLTQDGSMERLKEKIESIEDEKIKAEKMKKFTELSRSLEKAEGIPEILQKYVKPGQKHIVFLPSTAMQTEDDKKIGEAKIEEYKKKLEEYFKDSEITPEFYSMLGTYSKGKNESQLREFETSSSPDTKFMIVIDKAREGLHIAGLNGMVWFRPLDENSNILYHQQLGRVIHSEDPLNPTKDEDRPIVIDLANNTFRVRMDKQVKTYTSRSDLDLLCAVIDWVQNHNGGVLPDVESLSKQEKRYAATLYRLQNKYLKYFDDENFEGLKQEEREEIQSILDKGYEIDLWETELQHTMSDEEIDNMLDVDAFKVSGIIKDFVVLEDEIDSIENTKSFDIKLELLKGLLNAEGEYLGLTAEDVKKVQKQFKEKGSIKHSLILKREGQTEPILIGSWLKNQRKVLNKYRRKTLEDIEKDNGIDKEEKRRVLELIKLGVSFTEDKNPEEIWNEKMEMLKGLKVAKGEYLRLTAEEVKNIQKQFKEQGTIKKSLGLKKEGHSEPIAIGYWLADQRQMLKKYRGKTKEEIKKEEGINEEEKRRVLELLDLGVSFIENNANNPEEIWNEKLEFLKGLLDAKGKYFGLTEKEVKKLQKQFKEKGSIKHSLILKREGHSEPILIGVWLNTQRNMLNKYRGKTKEEIKKDEGINEEEKRRVLELLDLGVSFTEDKTDIWNEKLDLLKGLLDAKGEYLGLTEKEVKKVQKQFKEQGLIQQSIELKKEENNEHILIGDWLSKQRILLNNYRRKTIEEIKKDEGIDKEEKRRVLELLGLGVSFTEDKTDIWNEKMEILKGLLDAKGEYLGLTEKEVKKVQKQFKEQGLVQTKLKLKLEGHTEPIAIGYWLADQRRILNKYRGKTQEEIEKNEGIDKEEKRRVLELIKLGVSFTEDKNPEEIWNQKMEMLKGLIDAKGEYLGLTEIEVKKVQKQFREQGSIKTSLKLKVEGQSEPIPIGTWLDTQRQKLNKYRGKTQEEIEKDETIKDEEKRRVLELLKLGVSLPKKRVKDLQQAKQSRDDAKAKNDQAKELEEQVSEELKKRGKNHEEQ